MSARHISQREARQLRKRVAELEERDSQHMRSWTADYIGGVNIANLDMGTNEFVPVAIRTARALGHPVVVTCTDGRVRFFGVKP
jgi:hypothetical protein